MGSTEYAYCWQSVRFALIDRVLGTESKRTTFRFAPVHPLPNTFVLRSLFHWPECLLRVDNAIRCSAIPRYNLRASHNDICSGVHMV